MKTTPGWSDYGTSGLFSFPLGFLFLFELLCASFSGNGA